MSPLLRSDRFLLLALILWLAAQYFVLGRFSIILMADEGDSTLSGVLSLPNADEAFPLWSPFPASGTDRLALGYTPPLLGLLFQLFSSWIAYAIAHTSMIALGVVGTFMLGRQRLAMTVPGAFFAALMMGSAFSFTNLSYFPVAATPLALLALSNLLDDMASARRWLWAGLAAALFSLPASMTVLVLFPGIFFGAWYLVYERRLGWRDWAVIALFFIFVYVLRAQDILAMGLNAGMSQRINWAHQNQTLFEAAKSGLIAIAAVLEPAPMVPSLPSLGPSYTTISIYLFFAAVILTKGKNLIQRRLLLLLLACLALSIVAPLVKSLLYDLVPVLRGFSVNKVWAYARVIAYIGAGFAVQNAYAWIENNRHGMSNRKARALMAAPFVIVLGLGLVEKIASSAWNWVSHGSHTLMYKSPILMDLAERIRDSGQPSRVASFQMYDVTANAYGLESVGGKLDLYSGRYKQFWLKMVEPSVKKFPDDAYHLKTYNYMELGLTYNIPDKKPVRAIGDLYHMNMFSLLNARYFLSRDQLTDAQFREAGFTQPPQPWSALSQNEKVRANIADNFRGRTNVYVYENTDALPRFFLAERLVPLPDRDATLDATAATAIDDLRKNVFADKGDLPEGLDGTTAYSANGKISIRRYSADEIDLDVELTDTSLLVVGNSYSPYWKVFIDGIESRIFPAYVALWGIEVPGDAKTVSFRYNPPYRVFAID